MCAYLAHSLPFGCKRQVLRNAGNEAGGFDGRQAVCGNCLVMGTISQTSFCALATSKRFTTTFKLLGLNNSYEKKFHTLLDMTGGEG